MRPVVWSASSVNTYMDCHLKWYFTYVAALPSEASEPQKVGIAVHDYAEKVLKVGGYIAFDPEIEPLVEVFHNDILPTYGDAVLIEAPFQIEVNGIPFSGVIDSVDKREVSWDEILILRDLKTTGSRPAAGKYRLAMTGYWLGATDLGFPPDAMQLDYIVRTKKPYYWPELMEPVEEYDIATFAATLQSAADGVQRADYQPTALGTRSCLYCGHRASCGPHQRYAEVAGD